MNAYMKSGIVEIAPAQLFESIQKTDIVVMVEGAVIIFHNIHVLFYNTLLSGV